MAAVSQDAGAAIEVDQVRQGHGPCPATTQRHVPRACAGPTSGAACRRRTEAAVAGARGSSGPAIAARKPRGGGLTDCPPQSGTVTADTPLKRIAAMAVPAGTTSPSAGGMTAATRCPSQALGLQVVAARAGRSPSTTRSAARPRA